MSRKPETLQASRHSIFRGSLKGYGDKWKSGMMLLGMKVFIKSATEEMLEVLKGLFLLGNKHGLFLQKKELSGRTKEDI